MIFEALMPLAPSSSQSSRSISVAVGPSICSRSDASLRRGAAA